MVTRTSNASNDLNRGPYIDYGSVDHKARRMPDLVARTQGGFARRILREAAVGYRAWLPRLHLANMVCRLMPQLSFATVRAAVYRSIGFDIGSRVSFFSSIAVIGTGREIYGRLSIGEGSIIALGPIFNLDAKITIGRNVAIAPFVSIYTSTHLLGPASRRMQLQVIAKPVVIEDGVWIGAGSIILPGVVIGRGSVVSAGSVVKSDVPPNTLVAGNPAKTMGPLPMQDR